MLLVLDGDGGIVIGIGIGIGATHTYDEGSPNEVTLVPTYANHMLVIIRYDTP